VLQPLTTKVSLPFQLALREYAEAESRQGKQTISQGKILGTLALRASPELRRLYRQYEQLTEPASTSSPSSGTS
jgi:hypothetical protein